MKNNIYKLPAWGDLAIVLDAPVQLKEPVKSWDELQRVILQPFDVRDLVVRSAVNRWVAEIKEVQSEKKGGEMVHRFSTREVQESVVRFCRADILENCILHLAKISKCHRTHARNNIPVALAEHEGIFISDDEGEQLVPELLAVRRVTAAEKVKALKQVVQSTAALAQSAGEANSTEPEWPTGVIQGLSGYVTDLKDFISGGGKKGLEFLARVCSDAEFASQIREEEKAPACIKFLAGIVVELGNLNIAESKGKKIGFNPDQRSIKNAGG